MDIYKLKTAETFSKCCRAAKIAAKYSCMRENGSVVKNKENLKFPYYPNDAFSISVLLLGITLLTRQNIFYLFAHKYFYIFKDL